MQGHIELDRVLELGEAALDEGPPGIRSVVIPSSINAVSAG
jgi:hypothetical protein